MPVTEEELQELSNSVIEARNHLIELLDAYNEILTKEHEAQTKKNTFSRKNMSISDLFEVLDIETTPKSEEEREIKRSDTWYAIRLVIILFFGLALSPWAILPAAILVVINSIYSGKKNNKIREKYKSKAEDAREEKKEPEKTEKDTLYEKVCEAREIYHTLRKEYESKQLNSEIQEKIEADNAMGTQDNGMDSQLYQIYSEYIDYVKSVTSMGISRCVNNKRKVYGINPEEL